MGGYHPPVPLINKVLITTTAPQAGVTVLLGCKQFVQGKKRKEENLVECSVLKDKNKNTVLCFQRAAGIQQYKGPEPSVSIKILLDALTAAFCRTFQIPLLLMANGSQLVAPLFYFALIV